MHTKYCKKQLESDKKGNIINIKVIKKGMLFILDCYKVHKKGIYIGLYISFQRCMKRELPYYLWGKYAGEKKRAISCQ